MSGTVAKDTKHGLGALGNLSARAVQPERSGRGSECC